MSASLWWSPTRLVGYFGMAPHDGLQWERHGIFCEPGLWRVSVTGWWPMTAHAVMDDFGNLVQVPA